MALISFHIIINAICCKLIDGFLLHNSHNPFYDMINPTSNPTSRPPPKKIACDRTRAKDRLGIVGSFFCYCSIVYWKTFLFFLFLYITHNRKIIHTVKRMFVLFSFFLLCPYLTKSKAYHTPLNQSLFIHLTSLHQLIFIITLKNKHFLNTQNISFFLSNFHSSHSSWKKKQPHSSLFTQIQEGDK